MKILHHLHRSNHFPPGKSCLLLDVSVDFLLRDTLSGPLSDAPPSQGSLLRGRKLFKEPSESYLERTEVQDARSKKINLGNHRKLLFGNEDHIEHFNVRKRRTKECMRQLSRLEDAQMASVSTKFPQLVLRVLQRAPPRHFKSSKSTTQPARTQERVLFGQ